MGGLPAVWVSWQHGHARDSRLGPSMRLAVAVSCVAMLMPLPVTAFAQAGSTGGTIGKTDKSAVGESAQSPRALQTIQPDRAGPHPPISGKWLWEARCGFGNFHGEFEIGSVTARQFTGA